MNVNVLTEYDRLRGKYEFCIRLGKHKRANEIHKDMMRLMLKRLRRENRKRKREA